MLSQHSWIFVNLHPGKRGNRSHFIRPRRCLPLGPGPVTDAATAGLPFPRIYTVRALSAQMLPAWATTSPAHRGSRRPDAIDAHCGVDGRFATDCSTSSSRRRAGIAVPRVSRIYDTPRPRRVSLPPDHRRLVTYRFTTPSRLSNATGFRQPPVASRTQRLRLPDFLA